MPGPPAGTREGQEGQGSAAAKGKSLYSPTNTKLTIIISKSCFQGKADYRDVSTSAPGERGGRVGDTKLGEELKTHPSEQESILS